MKRLERTKNDPRFVAPVTEFANVPSTIGVKEIDDTYDSHRCQIHMADDRAPTPDTLHFAFPISEGQRVQGYLTDGLTDPTERDQFLTLFTKIRDTLAAADGHEERPYVPPVPTP